MFRQLYNLIMRIRHWLRLIPRYQVTAQEVQGLMHSQAPNLAYDLKDRFYTITTQPMMDWLIGLDWTDAHEYVDELQDCDDFALLFEAHMREFAQITAVGLVTDSSTNHAYNAIVVRDGSRNVLRFFEPQNDHWVPLGSGMYRGDSGEVIW